MSVGSAVDGPDSITHRVVFDISPFPVVLVDGAGLVVEANSAAREMFPEAGGTMPWDACAPAWLARAHAEGEGSACGAVGGRSMQARASSWPGRGTTWWLTDRSEMHESRGTLDRDRDRADFLADVSALLLSSLNVERCRETTAMLAAGRLADAAIVVTPSARRRAPFTAALADGPVTHALLAGDAAEVPGLAEALCGFPPVPSRWIDPACAPAWIVPEGFGAVGAMIVVPLPGNGVPAGALILLRSAGRAGFSADEEAFARLFAARAGAAISATLLFNQQSEIARVLLEDLLPPGLSRLGGVEFAGGYRPARGELRVGGDFYDVHPPTADDPCTLAVLGDVCGKGIEAAVMTGRIRSGIHALRTVETDHVKLLRLLNGALFTARHARFATLVLASARRAGRDVAVRVTCGGHPAPLVVRNDGAVHEVPARGTLVGALPEVNATSADILLAPGETCLLYSDGITEARGALTGREPFGAHRLGRALAACAGMPAEAVVERVQLAADRWTGSRPGDDMAVLAVTAPLAEDGVPDTAVAPF